MTDLVVRRLLVDLEQPFERHWCGGDPFRTALFNALSMSFPVGEQFFIDAVRDGHKALDAPARARLATEVQGFVGQEATHRRLHGLYNDHLTRQGLLNHWAERARRRVSALRGADPRHALAITAASEHFTALMAEWMLGHPEALGGKDERLQTLWLWHSAEEAEHRSTAFDLYLALGGDHAWRITWFRRTTVIFLSDVARQTINNLWHDGSFWKWRTWKSAAQWLFGAKGLVRLGYRPWREYLRADFHPSQQGGHLSERWLAENASRYIPVGARTV